MSDNTLGPHGELVVLLDESGNPIGEMDKRSVHHDATPLHLAFSCYLFNAVGEILITRRALAKATWPGVWTNSFCGHPAPRESLEAAIARRAQQELGATVGEITPLDTDFRYRATDANGVVENEVCPVYRATLTSPLTPNPDEVMDWAWAAPAALREAVTHAPFAFSPWMILQLPTALPTLNSSTTAGTP